MQTSDSEDFESADEGHDNVEKKERKKRLSSSNYSDNVLESDEGLKKASIVANEVEKSPSKLGETTDGWDDFDIDENDTMEPTEKTIEKPLSSSKLATSGTPKEDKKSEDTGWDDFGDWGQDDFDKNESVTPAKAASSQPASTNNSRWGWGWGFDSFVSTATAGITTLTSQVSQGISTVLETGIGAPDPEELAKQRAKETEAKPTDNDKSPTVCDRGDSVETSGNTSGNVSDTFGNLISGVTKFVETTGSKVITGGLDTLETIGKKTMEVLQDGDPGLVKKRAMLGLDPGDKPVLSQVLREAKARSDEEDRIREEKREAKEVHYENLFDDFEGLVHLEALEMLSRQVNMRIEERLRNVDSDKKQEIKETLQQVAELCEMPEEDDDDDEKTEVEECSDESVSKPNTLNDRLQTATRDLGIKVQFQPLVKQYTDILDWLSTATLTEKTLYKRGVSSLAHTTALCVEIYHKIAEMLLVKTRRSTADESDALTQMTVVLTKHISELATLFTEKLNAVTTENKTQVNTYITNIFLDAGNSSTYIQNAFQLTLPILQIGAV